jgi:hypothetical protein
MFKAEPVVIVQGRAALGGAMFAGALASWLLAQACGLGDRLALHAQVVRPLRRVLGSFTHAGLSIPDEGKEDKKSSRLTLCPLLPKS